MSKYNIEIKKVIDSVTIEWSDNQNGDYGNIHIKYENGGFNIDSEYISLKKTITIISEGLKKIKND